MEHLNLVMNKRPIEFRLSIATQEMFYTLLCSYMSTQYTINAANELYDCDEQGELINKFVDEFAIKDNAREMLDKYLTDRIDDVINTAIDDGFKDNVIEI